MRSRLATVLTVELAVVAVVLGLVALLGRPDAAAGAGLPTGARAQIGTLATTRTSEYDGWNWANPDVVAEYAAGGLLGVVRRSGSGTSLGVTTYDPTTLQAVGSSTTVDLSGWPLWGAFHAGADGSFYVVVGRPNPTEDDNLDVVAIRRYDAAWRLVGTAYVKGGATQGVKGVYSPFEAGHPHLVLSGNRLVLHMSRLIYGDSGGVHHQVNLTVEVNVDTMVATPFGQVGSGGFAYSSHSFQQLVAMNGTSLVTVDHGDAYPRAIQLGVMAGYPGSRTVKTYRLFDFNGAVGDNFTGTALTGLVSGPRGVVVLGTSIRHPDAPNGPLGSPGEARNVYAIAADPATGAHTLAWLTDFAGSGNETATEPRVVQVAADQYAVLFGVRTGSGSAATYRLEYRLISSSGAVLATASFPGVFHAAIDDPVLVGGQVFWVGIQPGSANPPDAFLYGLDVTVPTAPTLAPRPPGGTGSPTATPTSGPAHFTRTKRPRITGQALVGHRLRARHGTWKPRPSTYAYRWYRDGKPIKHARSVRYTVKTKDVGHQLKVRVVVKRPGYVKGVASSAKVRVRRS